MPRKKIPLSKQGPRAKRFRSNLPKDPNARPLVRSIPLKLKRKPAKQQTSTALALIPKKKSKRSDAYIQARNERNLTVSIHKMFSDLKNGKKAIQKKMDWCGQFWIKLSQMDRDKTVPKTAAEIKTMRTEKLQYEQPPCTKKPPKVPKADR